MNKQKINLSSQGYLLLVLIILVFGYFYITKDIETSFQGFDGKRLTGYVGLDPQDGSRVERSFSKNPINPSEFVNITLEVIIDESFIHNAFALEEIVPAGWIISHNPNGLQEGNVIKWAEINEGGLQSKTYSYSVYAPSLEGEYIFSGDYIINGMDESSQIAGENRVNIVCSEELVNTTWSEWENETCLENNTMRQSSYLIEYDSNNCGSVGNTTFYRYREELACDFDTFIPRIYNDWNNFNTERTTNFSLYPKEELKNLENVRFTSFQNKTELFFLERINISRNIDLRNNLELGDTWVYLNSEILPEFNKRAKIEFFEISFQEPILYRYSSECPQNICSNIIYENNTYSFEVIGFSNYSVVEGYEESEEVEQSEEDYEGIGGGGSPGGGSIIIPIEEESEKEEPIIERKTESQKPINKGNISQEEPEKEVKSKKEIILVILIINLIILILAIIFVSLIYYKKKYHPHKTNL